MKHLLRPNLALLAKRQARDEEYNWFFVTNGLVVNGLFSIDNKGREQVFPLYLYDDDRSSQHALIAGRRLNFSTEFLSELSRNLGAQRESTFQLPDGVVPEEVFQYIYAIFHSPTYRTRYAEFLKIDFPRVPLTSNLDLFRALAALGGELVTLHLMESPALARKMLFYDGPEWPRVEKVSYGDEFVWLDKACTYGFDGMPEAVWNFRIGGYQVCEKWLKDRGPKKGQPGRLLSPEDIDHYQRIVVALHETIRLMGEIDGVIEEHGGWPIA